MALHQHPVPGWVQDGIMQGWLEPDARQDHRACTTLQGQLASCHESKGGQRLLCSLPFLCGCILLTGGLSTPPVEGLLTSWCLFFSSSLWRNLKFSQNLGNEHFLPSVTIKLILAFKISNELIDSLNPGLNTEIKFK